MLKRIKLAKASKAIAALFIASLSVALAPAPAAHAGYEGCPPAYFRLYTGINGSASLFYTGASQARLGG